MKRMWQNWLAVVTLMTLTGTSMAQNGWNQSAEIGSYQSILSRAGCDSNAGMFASSMGQQGVPMQGSAMYGGGMNGGAMNGANMNGANMYGGAMMQGGGMVSGGAVQHGAMMQGGANVGMSSAAAVNGAAGMHGSSMGAAQAVQGYNGVVAGNSVMSGPAVNGSVMSGQVMALPQASGSVMSGAVVGGSQMYGDLTGGSVMAAPAYSAAPVYSSAPIYTDIPQYTASPVFQQSVVAPIYTAGSQRQRANYTAGVMGLIFQRDYEDNRYLASNPAGETLFTNDSDEGSMDGYAVNFGSRNCNGSGFEVGYWALSPGRTVATLTGANVATSIQGFDNLTHVSSGRDLYDIYSNTTSQTIARETDINSLEFNLLRNGGAFSSRRNRRGFYEMIGGFRWFEFNENMQYGATIDTGVYPATPSDFFYNLNARNRLLGFQLGARNEYCLGSKLRFFSGVKGGIFNNNIRTTHNMTDINGEIAQVNAGPQAGRDFSYNDEKNDVAFLGELDFGILYHLTCRSRVRLGYRVLGVSGVALAADQMAYNYADPDELARANSNGSLLLNGGYYGIEFCF